VTQAEEGREGEAEEDHAATLEPGGEEAGSDEVEEEPGEDPGPVELAPVTLHVPVLRPTFFALEAIEYAGKLRAALGLEIEHASPFEAPGEGAEGDPTAEPAPSALLEGWLRANRAAALSLKDPLALTIWPAAKSRAWWSYGKSRGALGEEFGPEGILIPALQAAQHEGTVKTICVWEQGTPSVIPRTDIVLVRRERRRAGLFGSKRVCEEGIADGERLWEILAPLGELRSLPADLIIWRGGAGNSEALARRLDSLELEPLDAARRTELAHVIDVDPSADPKEEAK
jgi:hypothetical protein